MKFEDYITDVLDMHIALMSRDEIKSARESYNALIADKKHKSALEKASASRALAKFYGGKALVGSAAQKKWAEDIRCKVLGSDELTDDEKSELVTCGGFANTAKFWIENRNVEARKMTARNIVAQYRALLALQEKHVETLSRTCATAAKNAARKEIEDYINSCDFKF